MSIKLFMPDRSDGGNTFLCLNCVRAARRSGTGMELEIVCNSAMFGPDRPIPFRVTECSEHAAEEIRPRGRSLKAMEAEAMFLVTSVEGRGFTFVDGAEFKRRCANGIEGR